MIVAVPTAVTLPPVTRPEVILMDAMEAPLLLHVPPVTASLKVVVAPPHMIAVPMMGVDKAVTVTAEVVRQPVGNV